MHYDLYRLKTIQEIKQLAIFEENKKTIKIIEWPELLKNNIGDKLEVNFEYTKNDQQRIINLSGYGRWKNFKVDAI